jgi:hypothetical protein
MFWAILAAWCGLGHSSTHSLKRHATREGYRVGRWAGCRVERSAETNHHTNTASGMAFSWTASPWVDAPAGGGGWTGAGGRAVSFRPPGCGLWLGWLETGVWTWVAYRGNGGLDAVSAAADAR